MAKKRESGDNSSLERKEAMTLKEMEVKSQERKILGPERKIDMNIILFVALCLCGLLIINVVLYFLIKESRYHITDVSETEVSENARGLLKERRQEQEALLADTNDVDTVATEQLVQPISDDIPEIVQGSIEQVLNETEQLSTEPDVSTTSAEVVEDESLTMPQQQAVAPEGLLSSTSESSIEPSDTVAVVTESPEPARQETARASQQDIQFDLVISVGTTINDWSNAWSAQDVDTYLSFYADTFVSEAGMNIDEWRVHRRDRLTKPEWISIGVNNLRINAMDDGGARAEFIQEYNASNYSDKELKKMIFRKVDDQWKIFDERATPVE